MGLFGRNRLSAELVADVREAVDSRIRTGFWSRDDVVPAVLEFLELEERHRPEVSGIVDELWRARLAAEQTWTAVGDHARVSAAFAELGEAGVLARMNFSCCNTCGTEEIDAERTPIASDEGEYAFAEDAYVFFHEQDAERLGEEPATLYLTYSSFRASSDLDPELVAAARAGDPVARQRVVELTDAAVGVRVAASLRGHGLEVVWDGDPNRRIAVTGLRWRKPLPD